MMQTITFECRTITPLVMNGAKGDEPELRPASIKGILRFWWRALHGHLELKDLKEKESKLFGDTKQRSKVLIRLEESLSQSDWADSKPFLLPHKGGNRKSAVNAFEKNKTFKIRFDFDETVISIQQLKSLFILTCTLGGFGKRSRRGFGSVMVTSESIPKTLKEIFDLIEIIVPKTYKVIEDSVKGTSIKETTPKQKDNKEDYPYIRRIEIGAKSFNSTEKIIKAASETHAADVRRAEDFVNDRGYGNAKSFEDYPDALGNGGRFASPIVASLFNTDTILITYLQPVPKPKRELKDSDIRRHDNLRDTFIQKLKIQ